MREESKPQPQAQSTLESWKAIASYLHRDVRTVQRWERKEGLPVRRHVHKKQATVYAYPEEIDHWRASRAEDDPVPAPSRKYLVLGAVILVALLALLGIFTLIREGFERPRTTENPLGDKPATEGRAETSVDEHIFLGWHYFDQYDPSTLAQAEEQFALVLDQEPDRVRALVGASLTQVAQAFMEMKPYSQAYENAEKFALRALELDPTEGEAIAILGWVKFVYRWDWTGAENLLREGVERSPDSPWTHWLLANYLSAMNHPDEAETAIGEALRLRPGSPYVLVAQGYVLANAGKAREAVEHWRRYRDALGLERISGFLIGAYEDLGDFDGATQLIAEMNWSGAGRLERAFRERGEPGYWGVLASAYLERLEQSPDYFSLRLAVAAAKTGDTRSALAMLERGFLQHRPSMVFLPIYPLDSLYGEPEFHDLVNRMGLQAAFDGRLH